jgi:hypothetical protein
LPSENILEVRPLHHHTPGIRCRLIELATQDHRRLSREPLPGHTAKKGFDAKEQIEWLEWLANAVIGA